MLKRKLNGMVRLFRPELALAAGVCVVLGQVLAAGKAPPLQIGILGFVCGFTLSAAALILNDYFDFEVDKVNHPQRPLPSGAVSRREVIGLTAATSLAGLAAAFALGLDALLIGILFWIIGILYNWRFKQSGLPGNLMVCASVAVTFILGAVSVQAPWSRIAWTFSLIVFFFDLGEEIAGDAMDMEGDKKRNSRSLALVHGKRFALKLCVGLWAVVIGLSLVPAVLGWLGLTYLIVILLTDGLIVFFALRLLHAQDLASGRRALRGAYLGASVGLVAFLVGQLFEK